MWVLLRVTAVVPSTPGIHVPAVHTASSDVGIELPATWQRISNSRSSYPIILASWYTPQ